MSHQLNTPGSCLRRIAGGMVLAIVLAAVFMAYLQPSFVVDLANRITLCT